MYQFIYILTLATSGSQLDWLIKSERVAKWGSKWSWSCCRGSADAENNYMIDMPKIASIDCKCIYPKQPGQFSPSGFPDSFRWIFGWLAGCCGISYDSMSNCNFNEQQLSGGENVESSQRCVCLICIIAAAFVGLIRSIRFGAHRNAEPPQVPCICIFVSHKLLTQHFTCGLTQNFICAICWTLAGFCN